MPTNRTILGHRAAIQADLDQPRQRFTDSLPGRPFEFITPKSDRLLGHKRDWQQYSRDCRCGILEPSLAAA